MIVVVQSAVLLCSDRSTNKNRLAAGQVLELDLSRRTPLPDVQLNMSVTEVVDMLRDDEAFSRKVLPQALVAAHPTTSSRLT